MRQPLSYTCEMHGTIYAAETPSCSVMLPSHTHTHWFKDNGMYLAHLQFDFQVCQVSLFVIPHSALNVFCLMLPRYLYSHNFYLLPQIICPLSNPDLHWPFVAPPFLFTTLLRDGVERDSVPSFPVKNWKAFQLQSCSELGFTATGILSLLQRLSLYMWTGRVLLQNNIMTRSP